MPITLTGLRRYPVKSCRGEDLPEALVEPWGLAGDRRWMLVDELGEKITARETPALLRVTPELVPGGLVLRAPGRDPLHVSEPDTAYRGVHIWGDHVHAASAGPEADAWFMAELGFGAHLVFLDDPARRPVTGDAAQPGDVVSFADGFPLLLASTSSLDELNRWVGGQDPLDIRRFRPNLVVSGAEPFAEDAWGRIRIGAATFRVASDCSRCVLTTVHPDTIERTHEPIATLARHRRWDGKVWFAVNLIPDDPGAVLRIGDPVEVLASRAPRDPARPAA